LSRKKVKNVLRRAKDAYRGNISTKCKDVWK